jgi:hypothetical protein
MEQSCSYEANGRLVSQYIPINLFNSKVHYRVHNSSRLILNLSQMNPINILPFYFFYTHCNIILIFIPVQNLQFQ